MRENLTRLRVYIAFKLGAFLEQHKIRILQINLVLNFIIKEVEIYRQKRFLKIFRRESYAYLIENELLRLKNKEWERLKALNKAFNDKNKKKHDSEKTA
jgi:hypothetical protein